MSAYPSSALVTLRPDLAQSVEELDLMGQVSGFVGLKIMPVFEVAKPFGNFGRIPIKELLKTRDTQRASDGSYNQGGGAFEPDTYQTKEQGIEERVDDREAEIYGDYIKSEQLAVSRSTFVVMQELEQRIITASLGISFAAAGTTGVAWTNTANAKPIDDFRAASLLIYARTGLRPNSMTMSWLRFQYLRDNAQIIDRVKYSGFTNVIREEITSAMIAQALGIDEINVAGSVKNTANEAKPATIGSQWTDDKVLVAKVARTNDVREPCFGRTFHFGADGSQIGGLIENYYSPDRRGMVYRCRMETGTKIILEGAAQVMTGL